MIKNININKIRCKENKGFNIYNNRYKSKCNGK